MHFKSGLNNLKHKPYILNSKFVHVLPSYLVCDVCFQHVLLCDFLL